MSQLEEIRERLDLCDKKIVSVLEERMDIIKEIMVYKKENGLPILQPEQEKRQRKMLLTHVDENIYLYCRKQQKNSGKDIIYT